MTLHRWLITAAGLVSTLGAVLFVLAPVEQDVTTYRWPADPRPQSTALPLFPYQPEHLDITFSCADAAGLRDGGTLVSTTPPGVRAGVQESPPGVRVRVVDDRIVVSLGEETLGERPVGNDCAWQVVAGEGGTTVRVDGTEIGRTDGVPAVNGLFTDIGTRADLRATVTADTRYESTPSALKLTLAAVTVSAVVTLLVLLHRRERSGGDRTRLLPHHWWRPRVLDVLVVGALAVWAVIGSSTVDDGYIITMITSAEHTGYVGNYIRWFNAPEAPFSWFYELYRPWAEISTATVWMRLPSLLIGVLAWLILDRLLLPRFAKGPARLARWAAAAVFLLWFVQFGIGLRPEPWVMLGSLVVLALVERGIASRRFTPLALGVVAAGATATITPTGIAVFLQLLVALPAAWPVLRRYGPHAIAVLLGVGGSVLLFMFHDQSLAAVLHATDVRTAIGPSYGLWGEDMRYETLFDPLQGGLNRRMPVLLTWFAMAVLLVLLLTRRTPKLATDPTRRLLIAGALYFAALALTPTKYTHHFGALGGVATLLLAVVVHTVAKGALRRFWARSLVLVALAVSVWIGLDAPLRWWFLGGLNVKWSEVPPGVRGIDAADLALVAGLVLAVAGLAGAWRYLRSPAWMVVAVAAGTVVVELATMAYAMVPRWDTYTTGRANLASITGESCGVEDWLRVEPDVGAGMLPVADGSRPVLTGGFVTNGGYSSDVPPLPPYGTAAAPVWGTAGEAGSVTTAWYRIPDGAESPDSPPIVVPARGDGAVSGTVQFADAGGRVVAEHPLPLGRDGEWADARFEPGSAALVRVVAVDERPGAGGIAVGAPRLPKVVPSTELVPTSEPVLLDWVSAFTMPCRQVPSVGGGLIEPVRYRFASGPAIRALGGLSYLPGPGGPYAPLYQLAEETPVPTYLRGDKLFEPVSVFRLDYPVPMRDVRVTHTVR